MNFHFGEHTKLLVLNLITIMV